MNQEAPPNSKIVKLQTWLKEELCSWVEYKRLIEDVEGEGSPEQERWIFAMYTDKHVYRFLAIDKYGHDGYLGCQVACRKPRAGESYTRGNDLPDGKFNRETWEKIKNAIIGWEVVPTAYYPNPEMISSESTQSEGA